MSAYKFSLSRSLENTKSGMHRKDEETIRKRPSNSLCDTENVVVSSPATFRPSTPIKFESCSSATIITERKREGDDVATVDELVTETPSLSAAIPADYEIAVPPPSKRARVVAQPLIFINTFGISFRAATQPTPSTLLLPLYVLQNIAAHVENIAAFELVCKTWKIASRNAFKRDIYVTLRDLCDVSNSGLAIRDLFPMLSGICVDLDSCPRCAVVDDDDAHLERIATHALLGCAPDRIKVVGSRDSSATIVSDLCTAAILRPFVDVVAATRAHEEEEQQHKELATFVRRLFDDNKPGEEDHASDFNVSIKTRSAIHIDVSDCDAVTDDDIVSITRYHTALETLSFAHCKNVTTKGLRAALRSPTLRTLDVSKNDFSADLKRRVAVAPRSLLALSLNGCSVHGSTVAELISQCTNLMVIDASDITLPQPKELVAAIASLPNLLAARFALWMEESAVIAQLALAPKLEWLDLGECTKFDGPGLARLLESRTIKRIVAAGRNALTVADAIEALDAGIKIRRERASADRVWDFSLVLSSTEQRETSLHMLEEMVAAHNVTSGDDEEEATSNVNDIGRGPSIRIKKDVERIGQIDVCYGPNTLPEWTLLFQELSSAGSFACASSSDSFRASRLCVRMCSVHRETM